MTSNASHIGITSEYVVMTESLKRGFNVLQPAGGFLSYDLVIDVLGRLVKIQVKTIGSRSNYCPSTRQINNKYRSGDESYKVGDFDFAFCVSGKDLFIVPFEVFTSKKNFYVSKKNEKFRNAWHLVEEFVSPQSSLV